MPGLKAIALARSSDRDTSDWEKHLIILFDCAGRPGAKDADRGSRILWQWRRESIPHWQQALNVAVSRRDRNQEEYARWMLREILLDPEYLEP